MRPARVEALVRSLDEGDTLDDADRAQLDEALRRSDEKFRAGQALVALAPVLRLGRAEQR